MRSGTVLVLGGARSGKSLYAEGLVERSGLDRAYIATAEAGDAEMATRIAGHRARRGGRWTTVEAPQELGAALGREAGQERAVLVDCLTLWLSNVLLAGADVEARSAGLASGLKALPGLVVLVTNEIGLGLVPDNALGRRFRDAQGRLNQTIAAVCDRVVFVAAGLPLALKGPLPS